MKAYYTEYMFDVLIIDYAVFIMDKFHERVAHQRIVHP